MYENGGAICGEKRTTNQTNKLHKKNNNNKTNGLFSLLSQCY